MPEAESRRHIRRTRWVVVALAGLFALVLLAVLVLDGRVTTHPEPAPTADSTRPTSPDPSDAGSASASPGPSVAPFSAVQRLSMTFPEKQRTDRTSFAVEEGETYLLQFDVDAEKPAGSPGYGFMLGLTLQCTDQDGRGVATLSGTQNLLTGEPVTLSNQLVMTPARDGVITCSMLANAPDADLAAQGTGFAVDVTWKVTEPVGLALPAQPAESLPVVIPASSSQVLLTRDVAVEELAQRRLDVLTSLQLTTCTGPGGSTEDGTQWCTEDVIDPTGSHFRFEVRYDVIGADGQVCGTIDSGRRTEYLDIYRHHQLYHVAKSVAVPTELCGPTIRTSINLRNDGPAGLLVHRAGTSMVTMETRPVS
ncbi:hypothetical protein V1260_08005 [Brachybacterium sp. J144]|uniref:hypothetical protein n=1 Tax=Brachybacterium sp. J144 TaxID=3116487 RepID=UPI002E7A38E3|nr:hypothetical protein [Brachybacterium sp. J144]MEE1650735.1 hypothetical protein [Brachybacterium sp. J144]